MAKPERHTAMSASVQAEQEHESKGSW